MSTPKSGTPKAGNSGGSGSGGLGGGGDSPKRRRPDDGSLASNGTDLAQDPSKKKPKVSTDCPSTLQNPWFLSYVELRDSSYIESLCYS